MNLGLNGADPVALAGLIDFYAADIQRKDVLLFWNPNWLSSAKVDLRGREEFRFNHPRLIPQFFPNIPCYTEHFSPRIGIVVEQRVPFESWAGHLQQAYYRDKNGQPVGIPEWTLLHPYENPLEPLSHRLPPSDYNLHDKPTPWTTRMKKQDYAWVDLQTSLQWHSFQRVVRLLKEPVAHQPRQQRLKERRGVCRLLANHGEQVEKALEPGVRPRRGADQQKTAHPLRMTQGQLLCDHASQR